MAGRREHLTFPVNAANASNGSLMHDDESSTRFAFDAFVARGANSMQVAKTACEVWRQIDASLSPIIGHRGVAALYRRSVQLLRQDHPSLAVLDLEAPFVDVLAELQHASAGQSSRGAAEMNAALLETFRDVLTKLIGASLAERLLRPGWDHLTGAIAEGLPP
jgi:hypothetical protein